MKKILILSAFTLISIGCGSSAPTQTQTNTNSTTTTSTSPKKDELTVSSHSTENQKPPMSQPNSNSGGSPNQKPADISAITATIEKAEKDYKAKPDDAKTKEILATAYFQRAFILTDNAQYSAALGDFRKGLKLNPNDQKAKDMHDQIVSIYQSMGREVPKEGEEKAPVTTDKK